MANCSIREEVHPKGSFDSALSLLDYVYDLKAGMEDSWRASGTTLTPETTPCESQTTRSPTSSALCPSGFSTPCKIEGAGLSTGTELQRDATQLAQSSDSTYPEPLQQPWTDRKKPPTQYHHSHGQPHLCKQPTGTGHNPETPGSQVPYQSDHQSVHDEAQDATQDGRPQFDCTLSFQQNVSPGGQKFEQQRQSTHGAEGGSELDKATKEWRRKFVARQRLESGSNHASGERS